MPLRVGAFIPLLTFYAREDIEHKCSIRAGVVGGRATLLKPLFDILT
jgi:hypothetical protein